MIKIYLIMYSTLDSWASSFKFNLQLSRVIKFNLISILKNRGAEKYLSCCHFYFLTELQNSWKLQK